MVPQHHTVASERTAHEVVPATSTITAFVIVDGLKAIVLVSDTVPSCARELDPVHHTVASRTMQVCSAPALTDEITGTTAIPGVLSVSVAPRTADCGRRIPDPKNNESAIKIFMGDTEAV
jgi:hypothetical protein